MVVDVSIDYAAYNIPEPPNRMAALAGLVLFPGFGGLLLAWAGFGPAQAAFEMVFSLFG